MDWEFDLSNFEERKQLMKSSRFSMVECIRGASLLVIVDNSHGSLQLDLKGDKYLSLEVHNQKRLGVIKDLKSSECQI